MKYEPPKFTNLKDMAFIDTCRLTEPEALAILESLRWPGGAVCTHCGSKNVTRLKDTTNNTAVQNRTEFSSSC